MSAPVVVLVAHIALLSLISFGGVPGVLPDLRDFVVITHGWISNQDFANCFAIVQALPGPNMILLMGFVGWKVGGLPRRDPRRVCVIRAVLRARLCRLRLVGAFSRSGLAAAYPPRSGAGNSRSCHRGRLCNGPQQQRLGARRGDARRGGRSGGVSAAEPVLVDRRRRRTRRLWPCLTMT